MMEPAAEKKKQVNKLNGTHHTPKKIKRLPAIAAGQEIRKPDAMRTKEL